MDILRGKPIVTNFEYEYAVMCQADSKIRFTSIDLEAAPESAIGRNRSCGMCHDYDRPHSILRRTVSNWDLIEETYREVSDKDILDHMHGKKNNPTVALMIQRLITNDT